jgi:hypothetical protein
MFPWFTRFVQPAFLGYLVGAVCVEHAPSGSTGIPFVTFNVLGIALGVAAFTAFAAISWIESERRKASTVIA